MDAEARARNTKNPYADLVGFYIAHNFSERGVKVYREVEVGASMVGKRRRLDLLITCTSSPLPVGIECKFQMSGGTADEKIPYALQDLSAMRIPGCLAYAGTGFSVGITHHLRSSPLAAYCYPDEHLARSRGLREIHDTWQLDLVLALNFQWWDIVASEPQLLKPSPEKVAIASRQLRERMEKQPERLGVETTRRRRPVLRADKTGGEVDASETDRKGKPKDGLG